MTDISPLIHIGYHKTASTLLQSTIFSDQSCGFQMISGHRAVIPEAFVLRRPVDVNGNERLVAEIRKQIQDANERGLRTVISHERLSGYPASGGFDQLLIAYRLKNSFPHAKILILIREQISIIYSMYLQTISDGGSVSLKRFLSPLEPKLHRRPFFRWDFYEYHFLIQTYFDLFGKENVTVLPYELIRSEPVKICRNLVQSFGGTLANLPADDMLSWTRKTNKGRPVAVQAIRRRLNAMVRNQLSETGIITCSTSRVDAAMRGLGPVAEVLRPFDKLLRSRMIDAITAEAEGRFLASNRATQDICGLDLAVLGYAT